MTETTDLGKTFHKQEQGKSPPTSVAANSPERADGRPPHKEGTDEAHGSGRATPPRGRGRVGRLNKSSCAPAIILLLFTVLIISALIITAYSIISNDDSLCVICQQAKKNCHNGYRINENCTEGIVGTYRCTDDGQNLTYFCTIS